MERSSSSRSLTLMLGSSSRSFDLGGLRFLALGVAFAFAIIPPVQYQITPTGCAAASIQECLRILGVRIDQHKIARIVRAGDDGSDGADEQDVLRALGDLGCSVDILETSRRSTARDWLAKWQYTAPILLSVDDWEHWVCLGGGCAGRFWLLDPESEDWNKAQNASWPLTIGTVLRRWRAAGRLHTEGGLYYGIAIVACQAKVAKRSANSTSGD